jgi:osmotically-inducible protein OsmY
VSDDRVRTALQTAIATDEALRDSSIEVQSVNNGAVLLEGRTASLSDHVHALEVARHVRGVRSVHSEIVSDDARADQTVWREYEKLSQESVENSRGVTSVVKDWYITSATKLRLLVDRETPGLNINVDTTDGIVTLLGTVPSQETRRTAELDAQKVSGVKQVVNRLEVDHGLR